ncbi:MAG: hypothetical protein HC866_21185 [Leptolyngbyaceae cyanobacterium RU_5_1]|nr:hypothetical protein [Leptolyngbyaceae cyanobacterium RU_5_1]
MLNQSKLVWHHGAKPPGTPLMDITDLKTKTRDIWTNLHELNDCMVPGDAEFQAEIQQYGDLNEETTWRNAYASLRARFFADGCLEDPQYLIEFYLLYASQKWGWRELLPDVIEQLTLIPEGLDALLDGFSTIQQYGCEYGADQTEVELVRSLTSDAIEKEPGRIRSGAAAVLAGQSN